VGAEITTETVPESHYDEWTRLLSESPDGSVYSLPRYLEILCQALGRRSITTAWSPAGTRLRYPLVQTARQLKARMLFNSD